MSPAFKALSTVCRGHSVKIVRSFQKEATKRLGISLDDHFGTNGNLVSAVGRGSQKRCKVCIVHVWEEDIGGKNGRPRSFSPIFFFHVPCAPLIGPTQISPPPLPTKTLESDDSLKCIPRTLVSSCNHVWKIAFLWTCVFQEGFEWLVRWLELSTCPGIIDWAF